MKIGQTNLSVTKTRLRRLFSTAIELTAIDAKGRSKLQRVATTSVKVLCEDTLEILQEIVDADASWEVLPSGMGHLLALGH